MSKGKVYLTGAGPGDEKLLTLKAVEALSSCDVVVYDYLASLIDIEKYAAAAEKIFVGKKGGNHTSEQQQINDLLIKLASEGKNVVRLKGGDPFMFGRGGEEALALVEAGVEFEVIPGVTSAYAVPAYAGIPITQRGYTSSVTFITGHEDPAKTQSAIQWEALAEGDSTLVFLMGIKNLPSISQNLLKHGKDAETPVAIIRWGTTSRQQVLEGTLEDITEKARTAEFKAPAIIVIGSVVELRKKLKWFEKKPLFGKRVVVTRSPNQANKLSEALYLLGATPIEIPVIKVEPPDSYEALDKAIKRQSSSAYYDWLIFTSANGVFKFAERLKEKQLDFRIFKGAKIAAIGPATKRCLKSFALHVDLIPDEYIAEGVLSALGDVKGKKILIPRAQVAREILPQELKKAGASVDVAPAYKTVADTTSGRKKIQALKGRVDIITFTSSSTVTNFLAMIGDDRTVLDGVRIAVIGPVSAKTAKENGLNVDIEAEDYTIEGLVKAIIKYARDFPQAN